MKKSDSQKPADMLVYRDDTARQWIFFNMDHIVKYISSNCSWRKLASGRIKGDFTDTSKKAKSQYLTYELRRTSGSYFLGANGNRGKKFIHLLMAVIPYYAEAILFPSPAV